MGRNGKSVLVWQLVLISFLLMERPLAYAAEGLDQGSFRTPPSSARPWVYWFPLNGNITREGITADLEAMQRVGIGGVLYMETDVGRRAARRPSPVLSGGPDPARLPRGPSLGPGDQHEQRRRLVRQRRPMDLAELSMQKLTVGETSVSGPRRSGPLPQPAAVKDFYRDITVLAFPMLLGDDVALSDARAEVSTSAAAWKGKAGKPFDGTFRPLVVLDVPSGKRPQYVQLAFAKPYMVRTLTLTVPMGGRSLQGALQVSDDGSHFKSVGRFSGSRRSFH